MTRFLQDQDPGGKIRKIPRKMKSGGEPAGTSTDDDDIAFEHGAYAI